MKSEVKSSEENIYENIKPAENIKEKEEVKQKEESISTPDENGIWVRVMNMVSAKDMMLYGFLQHAKIVKDTSDHLIIKFPSDRQFQYKNIKNGRLRDSFEHIVGNITGKDTKIDVEIEKDSEYEKKNEIVENESSKPKQQEQKQTVKKNQIATYASHKLKEEYKDDKFIQASMKELGAEIINVEKK